MDNKVLEIRHLTKRYGAKVAVDDLSLDVCAGDIYGFIGQNGAGKTTTLRALTGRSLPIGRVHGQALEGEDGQPLFALYHPASVLYNPALRATYAQDLAQLREKLQLMRLI